MHHPISASTSRRKRHGARFLVALTAIALVAAGCGGDDKSSDSSAAATTAAVATTAAQTTTTTADTTPATLAVADGETIVVGVLGSYSGPFGIYGQPMELALRARMEEAGMVAGNHPIELVFEDDATDPATAVTKAIKLVEENGAHIVVCCVNGAATLAVGPILSDMGIPQIGPIPNPAGLQEFETAFLAAPTAGYDAGRLGTYVAEEMGHTTAAVLASDFSYGREIAGAFIESFTAAGGEVVYEQYAPLGTQDFGSLLAGVPEADVVFGGFGGADGIAFVQQYEQFGLKERSPLVAHGPLVTELLLQQEGPAATGITAGFYYSSQIDNEENTRFKAALAAANPDLPPSHFTAGAWATGSVILAAIEAAGDDATNGEALAEAIGATVTDVPWGTLEFDPETRYAFGTTYIYTVIADGDTLVHEIVTTIE